MSLGLGLSPLRLGAKRGGGSSALAGPVVSLNWATGQDYSSFSVTSTSAGSTTGPWIKNNLGLYEAKPQGYPAHLEGCRVVSGAPAWTDVGGGAITNAIWRGIAPAATNLTLWSRDLTNAAWTKSNVTAAKTATGVDGVSNSATTLTATAGNGTCLQAITSSSSARRTSAFVKRRTGSGTINMTHDNGTTWTAVTVTGSWTRVEIPSQTLANPTIGFRLVTSGDEIDVDIVQHETGAVVTGPIVTTSVTASRVVETVEYLQAMGTDWAAVVGVDMSAGLPASDFAALIHSGSNLGQVYVNTSGRVLAWVGTGDSTTGAPTVTTGTTKIGVRKAGNDWTLKADASLGTMRTKSAPAAHTSVKFGGGTDTWDPFGRPISTIKIWDRAPSDTEFADA